MSVCSEMKGVCRWMKMFLGFVCIEITVHPVKVGGGGGAEIAGLYCIIHGAIWNKFRHITLL